jgi:hypothetical protein
MSSRLLAARSAILALLCLLSATAIASAAEAPDPSVRAEIDYLLDRVEHSGYVFIRNGSEHTGAEAAKHMRRKYEHFAAKGDILTVDDFIDLAGTKSLISGRQYTVRLPDDSVVPTAEWLRGEIQAYSHNSAASTQ